jgi:hypothetical protein
MAEQVKTLSDDEAYRIVEEMGFGLTFRSCTCGQLPCARLRPIRDALEAVRRDERQRALTDAARQECVFCAGVEGYNPSPVKAALPVETDAGSYVHRNDPPHGLAGIYCKAPRIRALIADSEEQPR